MAELQNVKPWLVKKEERYLISSQTLPIWGRSLTLPVLYDCYAGESVTPEQINAIKHLFSHVDWIEKAKKQVELYCRESVDEDDENQKKDNIFSYVKPESIFVKRDKDYPRIALMCKYRYDPEHGLAVVFTKNGEITVGSQDIIL